MANEELTKDIVRNKINEASELGWSREPEKSKNIIINKLLKTASKKQTKKPGRPEFIVTNEDYPNLVILYECKADIKFHKSQNGKKYQQYAVDGVLWYAKAVSKKFDVIAVAVSGEEEQKIKSSNYINFSEKEKEIKISSEHLNPIELYNLFEKKTKKKFEDHTPSQFSKELNERLHEQDIKEDKRCLLVSGILIAVQNTAFKKTYNDHKTTKMLFNSMIATIVDELEPKSEHSDTVKRSFEWMKSHKGLNSDRNFIVNLIDDINKYFTDFVKTYDYFDFISNFYVEFFRYASNAKSLGIVLTPPHITELFNDLAKTNKDSIILDNCCGTGSFLVSGLRHMIKKSDGNRTKEKKIKENQIYGIEKEQDMFVLALCNMKIHDDGKSNIFFTNCFNFDENKFKKSAKPTVGLLNPPFKPPKKTNEKEKRRA